LSPTELILGTKLCPYYVEISIGFNVVMDAAIKHQKLLLYSNYYANFESRLLYLWLPSNIMYTKIKPETFISSWYYSLWRYCKEMTHKSMENNENTMLLFSTPCPLTNFHQNMRGQLRW